ncbi:hypothetical protein YB2330_004846 [Saitoella coloradoensis]
MASEKQPNNIELTNSGDRSPEAVSSSDIYIDPVAEKKLLFKLDLVLTPLIGLLYLVSFLDRSNIGNAKIQGMPEDLKLVGSQFNVATSIFYITYCLFETPMALLLKIIRPSRMIPCAVIAWSLCTIFTCFVQNYAGLVAVRLIMGACEAGLFPSLNLYLTMVYKREEQSKRLSYLFTAAAVSGAFGGLIAYGISHMDGVGGYAGWRWLYILEGVFSILVAILVYFTLPDDPKLAWFLNEEERALVRTRQEITARYRGSEEFDWAETRKAARDPKVWLSALIQFCADISLYGFSTFLPAIIRAMGYSSVHAQLLTVPVYLFGSFTFIVVAIIADRTKKRFGILLVMSIVMIIGYILFLSVTKVGVLYFATFLIAAGVYIGPGLNLGWLNINVAGHYKRATAVGIQQSLGNLGGVVAGQIYYQAPRYWVGYGTSVGAMFIAVIGYVIMYIHLKRLNAERDRVEQTPGADASKFAGKTGDEELEYRYQF